MTSEHRLYAQLVRGQDRWRHFDLLPDAPKADFDPDAVKLHELAYAQFRKNYYEQERRHLAQFAKAA